MLFRKIVSNLPFSPALLNQLGFYAKRLQREQATRRAGLLFTALALIVQTFAMMSPPEPALAANTNNIVFNGIRSKEDLLNAWDRNTDGHGNQDIQQVFKYFLGQDFSRKDLEDTKSSSFASRDKVNGGRIMTLGRTQQTSDPDQKAYAVRDAQGQKKTIWARHLDSFDSGANRSGRGSVYNGFIGDHKGKWFAIMPECGNLAFSDRDQPPSITPVATVKATCREITGYAYDRSNLNAQLKVYVYLDGGPGKGEKYTTVANLGTPDDGVSGSHGFQLSMPAKFHTGKKYNYSVVVMPAFGENDSTQLNGVIDTANCKSAEPVVQCTSLSVNSSNGQRTKFKLSASGNVANNGTIDGYHYTVKNQSGNVVFDKSYPTGATSHSTEKIDLPNAGSYTAAVSVMSPLGEKTDPGCTKQFSVVQPQQCVYNPSLNENDPECKPCPGNPDIWAKDEACNPEIIKAKTVQNLTKNTPDANGSIASPGDRLQYDLFIENTGVMPATLNFEENLGDVLEYADLANFSGTEGNDFNPDNQAFAWLNVTIAPGQKITKTIVVNVKQDIPATPRSVGNPESYDCKMGNVFGGTAVTVRVQCPGEKIVENTVSQLPTTGTGTNILFSSALIIIVTYFYARARQMRKELRLIQREFNHGAI